MRGAQAEVTRIVAEVVKTYPMGSIVIQDDMGSSFTVFARKVAQSVPSHIIAAHPLIVAQTGIIYGAETLRKNGIKGANASLNAYIQGALFSLSASPARYQDRPDGKVYRRKLRSGDTLNRAFNMRSATVLEDMRAECALERDAKNRRVIRRTLAARRFWNSAK